VGREGGGLPDGHWGVDGGVGSGPGGHGGQTREGRAFIQLERENPPGTVGARPPKGDSGGPIFPSNVTAKFTVPAPGTPSFPRKTTRRGYGFLRGGKRDGPGGFGAPKNAQP